MLAHIKHICIYIPAPPHYCRASAGFRAEVALHGNAFPKH